MKGTVVFDTRTDPVTVELATELEFLKMGCITINASLAGVKSSGGKCDPPESATLSGKELWDALANEEDASRYTRSMSAHGLIKFECKNIIRGVMTGTGTHRCYNHYERLYFNNLDAKVSNPSVNRRVSTVWKIDARAPLLELGPGGHVQLQRVRVTAVGRVVAPRCSEVRRRLEQFSRCCCCC